MSSSPPPPPPPGGGDPIPPPTDRPVRRSGDRVVAGVAAGLGHHFGIDPVLVRILFVILTFAAGLGALVYAVLWIVMPQVEGGPPATMPTRSRGVGFWIGSAAVAVGVIIFGFQLPAPRLLVPLALIAIGAALWQRPSSSTSTPTPGQGSSPAQWSSPAPGTAAQAGPAPSADTPSTPATGTVAHAAVADPGQASATAAGDASPAGADPSAAGVTWRPEPEIRWWEPPEPRPSPSWLGPIVVVLALLTTGVVAAFGAGDVLAVRGSDLVAVALLVLAGGLLVGTVVGRAKWLALPAAGLAGLLVAMQLAGVYDIELTPRVGEQYRSASQLTGTMDVGHGLGQVDVDLSDAEITTGATLDLDLAVGRAVVIVPEDVTVELDGQVGAGAVHWHTASGTESDTGELLTERRTIVAGRDLQLDQVLPADASDAPVLRIDVATGIGAIDLFRGQEVHDYYEVRRFRDWDEHGDFEDGPFAEATPTEAEALAEGDGFEKEEPVVEPTMTEGDWFEDEVPAEEATEEPTLGDPGPAEFVEECAAEETGGGSMFDCWVTVTPDGEVLDELVSRDPVSFFNENCMDPLSLVEQPGLVEACLLTLAHEGAEFRDPWEEN